MTVIMCTSSTHYQCIGIMNVMFYVPAAVASSIVACRAFTSLTNFRQKNIMHPRPPYLSPVSPACPHPNRGSGNDANGSVAKKSEGAGNTIMGAAFHSIVAGIDAMDQTYSMDEPDVTRMTRTLAIRDLECECDSGGADKNGHIVVHTETMVHEDNVSVDAGGFGMTNSLGHGQEQKGFYA